MKKIRQLVQPLLINRLGLPSDIILDMPRITLIGQIHIYIENHQGLAIYSDTELKLKLNKGYIQVLGSSFVLKMMLPEEILLEGVVQEVKFIETNEEIKGNLR